MTKVQIIGLLMYRTNMRVEQWAKYKGFTMSTVYRVISCQLTKGSSTERVRKEIAADVEMDQAEIWPKAAMTQ
ncbi:MAG: hypothetical protein KKI15_02765 [Proteobacteria bacterium]|nr:hypothetical protein [Pseudomonadota bacterium]